LNRTLQQLCPILCSSTYRIARRAKATPVLLELLRAGSSFEIKLVSRARGYLSALLSAREAWIEHLNAVYCDLLFMGHA
jgi:hypothetical protein